LSEPKVRQDLEGSEGRRWTDGGLRWRRQGNKAPRELATGGGGERTGRRGSSSRNKEEEWWEEEDDRFRDGPAHREVS
jgi:hypothetical protein